MNRVTSSLGPVLSLRASRGILLAFLVVVIGCRPADPGEKQPAASGSPSAETRGINYDPDLLESSLSWTPLKFEATVRKGAETVELVGDYHSWFIGAVYQSALGSEETISRECRSLEPRRVECDLKILRLAKFGRAEEPGFDWLVVLADSPLAGRVVVALDEEGRPQFPAQVEVEAHLAITLRENGTDRRLLSREATLLSGEMADWPQGLMVLALHQPVAYFEESSLDDPQAGPYFVMNRVLLAFADKPSEFFRRRPEVRAQVVDPAGEEWGSGPVGGVRLSWGDTSEYVRHEFVTHYNVYRNTRPEDPEGWQLLTSLPADTTSFLDESHEGRGRVGYLVTHGTEYPPFGYRYEGLYGPPAVLQAVR